ncbi:hypothetical protein SN15_09245 [Stenotrophomonas maltophilia]|nr:hypothetical protein SN15_09245 [Stenotrophomonas maltophilia]
MVDGKGPFTDLWSNRSLVQRLVRRDVRGRYQGSVFGTLWSFATPLMLLCAYWFVLGVVLQARFGATPQVAYPVVLFSGLIIHLFCAEVVGRAPGLIFENATYVKKVVFPLAVLPWMTLATALFHLLVNLTILLLGQYLIVGSVPPTWPLVFLVILPMLPLLLGLSWLLSAFSVFLRDIQQVVPLVLTMMMFLSPIFFPMEMIPDHFKAYLFLNPTTAIILQVRAVTIMGEWPDLQVLGGYSMISLLVMAIGYWAFSRTRRGFADVL